MHGVCAEGTGEKGGIGEDWAGTTERHFEKVRACRDGECCEDDGEDALAVGRIKKEDEDATESDGGCIAKLLNGFEGSADIAAEGNGLGPLMDGGIDGPCEWTESQERDAAEQEWGVGLRPRRIGEVRGGWCWFGRSVHFE